MDWIAHLAQVLELGCADLLLQADPAGYQGVREPSKCNALHKSNASDLLEHMSIVHCRRISNDFAALLKCCQVGRNQSSMTCVSGLSREKIQRSTCLWKGGTPASVVGSVTEEKEGERNIRFRVRGHNGRAWD